jgi:hypothetical protein
MRDTLQCLVYMIPVPELKMNLQKMLELFEGHSIGS